MKSISHRLSQGVGRGRGPLLLGLAGIAISIALALFVHRLEVERAEAVFLQMSARLVHAVQNRMNAYGEGLRRAHAFAGGEAGKQYEFLRYMQFLDLAKTQPGALSIGLLRQVGDENRSSYLAKWKNDFASVPLKMAAISGTNADAYIVEALEPGIFQADIRGHDFSIDPDLVKELQWVKNRDQDVLILSKPLSNLHRSDFFIFSPWYMVDSKSNKIFDRQGLVQGFIYMPVDAKKMMESIDCGYADLFSCEVLIENANKQKISLYRTSNNENSVDMFSRDVVFDYGTKQLTLRIASQQGFESNYVKNDSIWVLACGLLISMLLALFYFSKKERVDYKRELFTYADKHHIDDREIESILNVLPAACLLLDKQGGILKVNEAALTLFKISMPDICGKNIFNFFIDLLPADFEKYFIFNEQEQYGGGSDAPLKLRGVDFNGKCFYVKINAYFLKGNEKVICALSPDALREGEETKAAQERLDLIINTTGVAEWEWKLEGNKINWSDAMYSLYGLDPIYFHLDYASWSARISREDIIQFDGAIHAMLHGGESLNETIRIVLPDGGQRHLLMHGKLILDHKDQAERVIGTHFDISRVKEAEYALRESGERFSLAAQAAKEGIWDWNMQTGDVWFSSQWKANFGYLDHELENNLATWDRLIDPEDRKRFLHLTHEFNQGGMDRFEVTLRFKHKDGHWVSVRSRAVHLKNTSGDVVRMVGSHEDITELLKHEDALNESRKRMDLTIQCAGLGVWDWNIVSNEVLFGGEWAAMLGYDMSEIRPNIESWSGLTHPDDLIVATKVLQDHFDGKTPIYSAEFRMRAKDGSWRWILGVGRVNAFGPKGEPLRILGVNIDIHARRINEDALQAATLLAEAASRAKSEFLANMSHEIRTPLNAVLGFSALMQESTLNAQQRDLIDSIHTAGNSLLGIVNDLLDFSKIEAGRLELDRIDFNLRDICADLFILSAPKAYEKKLEIACFVSPDVPDFLMGDPARLRQILLNLINNAIKFTEKGHIVARVLSKERNDQCVLIRIEVSDSGLGLSEQVQSELFRPFTQADNSTTRRFGGTGLGLSLCKRLIDAMEGQIGVDSAPGEGASFWIEIPFAIANAVPFIPLFSEQRRVLVFEPFAPYAESLAIYLERLGLKADCYAEPEFGVAALSQTGGQYALVVMDERYEEKSLSARIHGHRNGVGLPIIHLMLARFEAHDRKINPLDFYLAKFVEERQLRHCIEEALQLGKIENTQMPVKTLSVEEIARLNLHVLVAEDNLINQKVAMMMLQKLGCEVDVANHGLEALNKVQKGHYDLVFMDCQMPEMDGYTSVALIRSLSGPQSQVPIVALTANAFKADEERCYAVGMNDFIAKPISVEHLMRVLSRFFFNQSDMQTVIIQNGDPMPSSASNEELDKEMASINHTFEDLKTMLGMDMTDELIQLFLPTLDECLANLGAVIEAGDGDAVVSCAHKLKGAAAQLGAQTLADLCKKVEQTGREKELANAWPYHAKIMSLGHAVGQRLRER